MGEDDSERSLGFAEMYRGTLWPLNFVLRMFTLRFMAWQKFMVGLSDWRKPTSKSSFGRVQSVGIKFFGSILL